MIFFSGFGFENEVEIFSDILDLYESCDKSINPRYTIAGFSYGAQKAITYALNANHRINNIILLSPAFFHDRDSSFKEKQILQFQHNSDIYMKYFLKNAGFIEEYRRFLIPPKVEDLRELLDYKFHSLDLLCKKGIEIDVYIGEKDNIINTESAIDFFKQYCVVYIQKNTNHLLKEVK